MTNASSRFSIPSRDSVSEANQALFDKLQSGLGFVPNLYAALAHSETALGDYLKLQSRKTSLSQREKEVVNLVVSQVNECNYCLSAHTLLAQKSGFSEQETLEIRRGGLSTDAKLDALARFSRTIAVNRGKVTDIDRELIHHFGYTVGNMVDIIILIGDKIITNYLHNLSNVAIDFPAAPTL